MDYSALPDFPARPERKLPPLRPHERILLEAAVCVGVLLGLAGVGVWHLAQHAPGFVSIAEAPFGERAAWASICRHVCGQFY